MKIKETFLNLIKDVSKNLVDIILNIAILRDFPLY